MLIEFKPISGAEAFAFIMPRHYAGRKPCISFAFGYFENDTLKAVCTFGKPASDSLCRGVAGWELSNRVFEPNRLVTDGETGKPLSAFVGYCLRYLKPKNLIIVSYADTQMGHTGYIYQATNWIYTGKTPERTEKYVPNGKHSRHYQNTPQTGIRKFRSAKHRYLFFTGNKYFVRLFKRALLYPILPYPKTENSRYTLGEFIKPILICPKSETPENPLI